MFNALPSLTRALSFGKIISGISKTLNVANQVIPLYLKARPIITNARSTLSMLKDLTKKTPNTEAKTTTDVKQNMSNNYNTIVEIKKADNEPTFFL